MNPGWRSAVSGKAELVSQKASGPSSGPPPTLLRNALQRNCPSRGRLFLEGGLRCESCCGGGTPPFLRWEPLPWYFNLAGILETHNVRGQAACRAEGLSWGACVLREAEPLTCRWVTGSGGHRSLDKKIYRFSSRRVRELELF